MNATEAKDLLHLLCNGIEDSLHMCLARLIAYIRPWSDPISINVSVASLWWTRKKYNTLLPHGAFYSKENQPLADMSKELSIKYILKYH